MSARPTQKLDLIPLSDVSRWPRNPRTHDDDAIESSIKRFGFVSPLIRDETSGRLVAGHGRVDALEQMRKDGEVPPARIVERKDGEWLVPVLTVPFASASEAEAYLLADNRIAEVGGWDADALAEIVRDLADTDAGVEGLGWSEKQLATLLAEVDRATPPANTGLGAGSADDMKLARLGADARVISIYFDAAEHTGVVARMRAIMDARKLPDYAALLRALLDLYDATAPVSAPSSDPFAAPE